MPTKFTDLPVELQKAILDHVYKPWGLCTKKVPAFSGYPVFTFIASPKVYSGPVLAFRAMHTVATEVIKARFTGELDASDVTSADVYSIMPKYKSFLPKVSTLLLRDWVALDVMGDIYIQRLSGLKSIILPTSPVITQYDHGVVSYDSLVAIVNTKVLDDVVLRKFGPMYSTLRERELFKIVRKKNVAVYFEHIVRFDGLDDQVVSESRNAARVRLTMNRSFISITPTNQLRS